MDIKQAKRKLEQEVLVAQAARRVETLQRALTEAEQALREHTATLKTIEVN